MAAKANTANDQIDLSTYDWVGRGIVNKDNTLKIKKPACGWCHPGSGPMEYARDANGNPTTTRYDELDEAAQADFDGDFWTLVGESGPGKSHWTESGVVEADCLLCHFDGYSFAERNEQLTYRNYKWAATAGAMLGKVEGKVYEFTNDATGNYLTGTYVNDAMPTVDYTQTFKGTASLLTEAGAIPGDRIIATPTATQCKQCHTSADTKKRGRTMVAETDIHLAAGLDCMDCHRDADAVNIHNIGKGYARLGTVADELDGTMLTCGECHDGRTIEASDGLIHVAESPAAAHNEALNGLDFHFDAISCETCHIPYKKYTAGELIDMSTGNQIWYLTSGDSITWPGDFGGNAIEWKPISKFYDPDGDGPMTEKLYPFGAKSSTWFGRLLEQGEIRPMLLKEVKAAWTAIGSPKVAVDYVKDGSTLMKPSITTTAQKVSMLLELTKAGQEEPVFVSGEVVYGLNESGDDIVAMQVEGEFDHNFSVNHDVKESSEALGAGGCKDCHSEGSALFETMQVVNVTGYLAESYKSKVEPYAEPAWKFQGYEESRVAELTSKDIGDDDDDDGCFVQALGSLTAGGFGAWLAGLLMVLGALGVIRRR